MKKQIFSVFFLIVYFAFPINIYSQINILHEFSGGLSDGRYPSYGLIYDGVRLFGTTIRGGSNDNGTIFSLNKDGSDYKVLHDFNLNEYYPMCDITIISDKLFGTTYYGGSAGGNGTIFSINKDGSDFSVLHEFAGSPNDGDQPWSSLCTNGVELFGMTYYGGQNNCGVIFKINFDGTNFEIIHNFDNDTGNYPRGALIFDGSKLYGMTSNGGSHGPGTIFSINSDGTNFQLLHEFDFSNGSYPNGSLAIIDGYLFGTTYSGGIQDKGTIFKINKDGSGFESIHNFSGGSNDGSAPKGDLVSSKTFIYGMTSDDWSATNGMFFKINKDGTRYIVLQNFMGGVGDGFEPNSGRLVVINKEIIGMTYYGGKDDCGVIFSYTDLELNIDELIGKVAKEFTVLPSYPNPFNPSTTIRYGLDTDSHVIIDIYDVSGKLISTLQNEYQIQGWHSINWNGTNQHGEQAPAGLYLSRIVAGNNVKTTKLMLLK